MLGRNLQFRKPSRVLSPPRARFVFIQCKQSGRRYFIIFPVQLTRLIGLFQHIPENVFRQKAPACITRADEKNTFSKENNTSLYCSDGRPRCSGESAAAQDDGAPGRTVQSVHHCVTCAASGKCLRKNHINSQVVKPSQTMEQIGCLLQTVIQAA